MKRLLAGLGFELRRLDLVDFDRRRAALLRDRGVDLVLDVGANAGQYGSRLRATGYEGRISSFEPLPDVFVALSERCRSDDRWLALPYGLGDAEGPQRIHASHDSVSSSVLEPTAEMLDASPRAGTIEHPTAEFRTLDSIWDKVAGPAREALLKLDVQGFEHRVLDGAEESLSSIELIEVEMALFPLYREGSQIYDLLPRLHSLGFMAVGVRDGFVDPKTHYTLDVDVLLVRR